MCGIAGIISFNGANSTLVPTIQKMSKSLRHRGPDDEGYLLINENGITPYAGTDTPKNYFQSPLPYSPKALLPNAEATGVLMHRRLSILDLSVAGHQPLRYNNLWIVFNGEIYNYLELKSELETLGCKFFSTSDTEVVLAAFSVWGNDCVNKFNGMWSLVIYNPNNQQLFISRDRLGVKPFYYIINQDFFAFSSEQKAFFESGLISRTINPSAFVDYFVLDKYESEEESFFKNVMELFPGHNATINLSNKTSKITKYFSVPINTQSKEFDETIFNNYKTQLFNEIKKSVALRMRSDVPVGSCLSGGIDSIAVVAIANPIQPSKKMNLFTAAFNTPGIGEQQYAEMVSKQVNGNWFTVYPTVNQLTEDLTDLIYSQDAPIWSTSTYAQYSVMRLASQNNTKVLLDGQGSDELFAGYPLYWIPYLSDLKNTSNCITSLKAFSKSNFSYVWLIKRFISDYYLYRLSPKMQLTVLKRAHPELAALSSDLDNLIIERIQLHRENFFKKTPGLNEYLFYETYNNRLKSYLKCEDRASMRHSVEARTPFADDINLITLAFSIPGNYKIANGQLKYLLRQAVKDYLPKQVFNRQDKMCYNTPNDAWIEHL
ncbi:MAG: asparagine synthase (glutamine-hydrolyzing), partial [Bacteroidia bacterium]|nr:asparagine synthase (glutamine-hydrolyzing) [Bacteroidia bacterium]